MSKHTKIFAQETKSIQKYLRPSWYNENEKFKKDKDIQRSCITRVNFMSSSSCYSAFVAMKFWEWMLNIFIICHL